MAKVSYYVMFHGPVLHIAHQFKLHSFTWSVGRQSKQVVKLDIAKFYITGQGGATLTKMSISVRGDDLEDAVVNGEQGDVEGAAAEIEHKDVLLAFPLVESVGDSCSSSVLGTISNDYVS